MLVQVDAGPRGCCEIRSNRFLVEAIPTSMAYIFATKRRRIVLPHRITEALAPLLGEVVELLDAIGGHLSDDRWSDAAARIRAARDELRRPSTSYEHALRVEQREREQQTRHALEQHLAELARMNVEAVATKRERDERQRERSELGRARARLNAMTARLEREVGRLPQRAGNFIPRKPIAWVRDVAARFRR